MHPDLFIVHPAETAASKRIPGNNALSRITSIDLLRGIVMIIMMLDHVRDYFHFSAFFYNPTDLTQTSVPLFFTRFVTHYCAPVFVFLAGISAFLYGAKRTTKQLAFFLLTRGIWLVLAELFIVSLFRTFNPLYTYSNLQVIWAIGISMIVLSAMIFLNRHVLLLIGLVLVFGHNLLDSIHFPGSFFWAFLHETKKFYYDNNVVIYVHYPILPWLGILTLGYCMGRLYHSDYNPVSRRKLLLAFGIGSIALFIALRSGNWYGDFSHWSVQKNSIFSFLSFINVSKYPPSLLYTLITLGPALIFLSFSEKPLNALTSRITVFGRVAMFYYLLHILAIHILSVVIALIVGNKWQEISVIRDSLSSIPQLKGYGYSLATTYIIWISLVFILYPFCKRFDKYKRTHVSSKPWLSYF